MARLNNIKDVNKISIGQELSLGNIQEPETTQNAVTYETEPNDLTGMDSFVRQEPVQKNEISPFVQGMAGGAAVLLAPKVLKVSKTAYTGVKSGTQKAYVNMKASAKSNAKAVRNFVARKAKHVPQKSHKKQKLPQKMQLTKQKLQEDIQDLLVIQKLHQN